MGRRPRSITVAFVVVAAVLSVMPPTAGAQTRPNILVIISDDQRYDSMDYMPLTSSRIGGQGVTFTNAFVTTPLCNPSRASLRTGQYAHTHGAQRNSSPLLRPTVFNALHSAG